MKCCIVPTVKEMIRLASYIKEKNLPRFKIISSDFNSVNREQVELRGYDYIGNLADLVHSSIPNLIDFIFGNVHVVRNSKNELMNYPKMDINALLLQVNCLSHMQLTLIGFWF